MHYCKNNKSDKNDHEIQHTNATHTPPSNEEIHARQHTTTSKTKQRNATQQQNGNNTTPATIT